MIEIAAGALTQPGRIGRWVACVVPLPYGRCEESSRSIVTQLTVLGRHAPPDARRDPVTKPH